ncbi:ArsA family ATPase [Streptomyces litchfieldiae]|uniref:ArsA-related P-loop ATPase n=1 Tax=Streptomyces litchfieldiae TaxID=3075543 RepID=A0ABU2MY26_9ACTN|nr:ArsA-related P-loop ATPase [Streptomyces sp. DSM 44938]MDT0346563.1 ArsA-related P-loop ATPase [Streptomyces sp. DSM 44938]
MSPARTLFVTGPGGDGTSTVAAATALAAARAGQAALLLSAEPPARLAALLGADPGTDGPAEVAPGLTAVRVDAADRFRAGARAAQRHLRPALDAVGAVALDDDELTELPGAETAALLTALFAAHAADPGRLVVVDLPPIPEGVRLLALPAQLRRYLRRLLPPERRAARALRPLLAQLAGVPLPGEGLYAAGERWDAGLTAVDGLVAGPGAAVRLVLDPGERSAAALRAARAGLALHGIPVEAVVANRLLPAGSSDPWLAGLADRQRAVLDALTRSTGLPEPHQLPHLGRDIGPAELAALAVPPPGDPDLAEPVLEDRLADDGLLVWHLPLPGATRDELALVRRGDELIVTTGPFRRALPLPAALRRCTVAGAALERETGELAVRFAPDPDRWPERALRDVGQPG